MTESISKQLSAWQKELWKEESLLLDVFRAYYDARKHKKKYAQPA